MSRRAERSVPSPAGESGKSLRKNIDAKTKRLGIRQVRGEDADPNMERVSVTDDSGKERFVSMSRDELKKAEERADRDFERTIDAVTAGEKLDKKMVEELLGSNKEEILVLARKEGDVKGAMYKVMEDMVGSLKEYDRLVDKAVADSGYAGIVADGLRDSLLKERPQVFNEALRQSAGPRAKQNLEHAVREKILAEASKQVAALAETVGESELVKRVLTEEQVRLARSYAEALNKADDANAKMVAAVKRLRKLQKAGDSGDELAAAVQEDDQYSEAWNGAVANAKRVGKLLEASGIATTAPEFNTRASRAELDRQLPEYVGGYRVAKPDSMEIIDVDQEEEVLEPAREVPFPKLTVEGNLRQRQLANERIRELSRVESAPDLPESFPADEWADRETQLGTTKPGLRRSGETLVPVAEEIPDVTEHMVLEEPPKKGFMQGLAKTGRKLMLGMALLFGMKAGAPDQRLPHQEDQGPRPETAAMMANMETMAAPTGEVIGDEGGMEVEQDESLLTETPKEAGDVIYKKGDPRNLKRALKILKEAGLKGRAELALEKHQNIQGALQVIEESGIPGKAEYRKMKAQEKREEFEAAKGRMEAMRLISEMKSPVLTAIKRAELQKKMDQHQAFLDLMGNLDEVK